MTEVAALTVEGVTFFFRDYIFKARNEGFGPQPLLNGQCCPPVKKFAHPYARIMDIK